MLCAGCSPPCLWSQDRKQKRVRSLNSRPAWSTKGDLISKTRATESTCYFCRGVWFPASTCRHTASCLECRFQESDTTLWPLNGPCIHMTDMQANTQTHQIKIACSEALWAGGMAQWVKVPATKSDNNLSVICETQWWKQRTNSQELPWLTLPFLQINKCSLSWS